MAKDGLIHVHIGGGFFSPCGARVGQLAMEYVDGKFVQHDLSKTDEIQQSCGDEFERVTCTVCMALVAKTARLYRKAVLGRVKWSENAEANRSWDPRKFVRGKAAKQ